MAILAWITRQMVDRSGQCGMVALKNRSLADQTTVFQCPEVYFGGSEKFLSSSLRANGSVDSN